MPDDGTISLQEVLSASLKALERSHAGRKIRIIRQIDPTTPRLKAGERRVKEILGTLLAEAAAGTEEGGRIRVCLKHSAAAVMVSIKDQGAGMEPGEWERRVADPERPRAPGLPSRSRNAGRPSPPRAATSSRTPAWARERPTT